MKKLFLCVLLVCVSCSSENDRQVQGNEQNPDLTSEASEEVKGWEQQAGRITIIRDNWGIPHVYGKTDADAVFGIIYAQAEDDFKRIERNYMNAMGILAQAEGESAIYRDLRMRLFIQEDDMKRLYGEAQPWLKELMDAFADGLNYYLYKHPEVRPKVITRFEPWMALSFSEGSIGGDIESVSINEIETFYGGANKRAEAPRDLDMEPIGSNGFSFAPSKTRNGNAILYINPHTSHYFREEAHMVSEEGLNAYGALTWGQFFIYQGFNEYNGWMHTSTRSDVIDEYLETIIERDGTKYYKYGDEEREVEESVVTIDYKTDGGMASKQFTVYHTHHGPVVRAQDGKWVSTQLMNIPLTALTQSYTRAKTRSYAEFYEMMKLRSNSSNNTVYADKDGNIAYFHGNFHPIRDTRFDFNHPVDGSNPATDWKGLHPLEQTINVLNPASGWLANTNNWPFSAAGPVDSPRKEDYPSYMSVNFENPRGEHYTKLFPTLSNLTVESVIEAGHAPLLPAFERFVPVLVRAYENAPDEGLREAVYLLRDWDKRSGFDSVETSLANYWGNELWKMLPPNNRNNDPYDPYEYLEKRVFGEQYLSTLRSAIRKMEKDFGAWKIAWGEINRFQRISPDIEQKFNDNFPSDPVKLVSARWGALASYGSRQYPGTKKWYGTGGNSFVASVEFGDKVRAMAITAGGLSSNPRSPHFNDQGAMYGRGEFREVNFYRDDVTENMEIQYHPGE